MSLTKKLARTVHFLAALSVLILAGMLFLRPREPEITSAVSAPSRGPKIERQGALPSKERPKPIVGRNPPRLAPLPRLPDLGLLAGLAYRPEAYRSRLVLDEDTYQVWELDPLELDWFMANTQDMTQHDFQLVSNDGGGLRIACLREGTFASNRGLKANDVLLDLNGAPLEQWSDISTLAVDPACNPRLGFRLTFERDGVSRVIDYRRSAP